jgi:aminopeptidase N
VVAAAILLSFNLVALAAAQSYPGGESPSPSEVHQYLAKHKALALEQARNMRAEVLAQPASQSTNYDVRSYDITIRVNDTTQVLWGVVTFVADAVEDNVSAVEVDFYSGMIIDSIVSPAGVLSYSRTGSIVTINLSRAFMTGEQFQFDFWYHGHPVEGGLQAFSFATHGGKPAISSLSEPYFARTWWPCKDRMDDKADTYKIQIEVDSGLYCASNGTLDSIRTVSANSRKFYYTMNYPMATYLFSVTIAPYAIWQQKYVYNSGQDTMPIVHHVYKDWLVYAQTSGWSQTPAMLAAYEQAFGPYPYLEHKYGHANFEWGGGMEHQTCTSMGADDFGFSMDVTSHELTHQWWGDMITCKSWHDIWINEGWASYGEAVYRLTKNGWADYHSHMNGMAYYGSGTVWCDDTTDVWRIFNGSLSYDKASWVVHMLRGVLGETKWAQGIDAYYNSPYKYGSITTEELETLWEGVTGEELGWFFDEWIYGQYYPKYEFTYLEEAAAGGGRNLYLVVNQVQTTSPRIFHMPVDFFFDYASGAPDDTLTLKIDDSRKRFKVHSAGTISAVKLDPAGWILKSSVQRAWTMYIVTVQEDISAGVTGKAYCDTIQYRGGSGTNTVAISGGALPPGLAINNNLIISGTPTDTGIYTFTVYMVNSGTGLSDQQQYSITVTPVTTCCTGPSRGNVDNSPDFLVTMGDLTVLIDNLFISLTPLTCIDAANVDLSQDNLITMGDLTVMIDHLFINLTPLPPCP